MTLPIDVIPNTNPPRFRWQHTIDSPVGKRTSECEGLLPSSVEGPVAALISMVKQQELEIIALRRQIQDHCDRIAAQSDLLSKKAEKTAPPSRSK